MPNALVKSFAKKSGLSTSDVEKLWDQSVLIAKKSRNQNDPLFFGLVVSILKNKIKGRTGKVIESKILKRLFVNGKS